MGTPTKKKLLKKNCISRSWRDLNTIFHVLFHSEWGGGDLSIGVYLYLCLSLYNRLCLFTALFQVWSRPKGSVVVSSEPEPSSPASRSESRPATFPQQPVSELWLKCRRWVAWGESHYRQHYLGYSARVQVAEERRWCWWSGGGSTHCTGGSSGLSKYPHSITVPTSQWLLWVIHSPCGFGYPLHSRCGLSPKWRRSRSLARILVTGEREGERAIKLNDNTQHSTINNTWQSPLKSSKSIGIDWRTWIIGNNNQLPASWSPGRRRAAYRVNGGHCCSEQLGATAPLVIATTPDRLQRFTQDQPHSEPNNSRLRSG